jgi:hypothetical protein
MRLELSRVPPCLVLDWKRYPEVMTTGKEEFDYLKTDKFNLTQMFAEINLEFNVLFSIERALRILKCFQIHFYF